MNTALVAFGAALFGALAGGLAAAVGSDWAQVRQIRRSARITMYEDLLAQWNPWAGIRGTRDFVGPTARDILDALRRSAVVAGEQEERLVHSMKEAWEEYVRPTPTPADQQAATQSGGPVRRPPSTEAQRTVLDQAVKALSDHLEGLIRKRGLRSRPV